MSIDYRDLLKRYMRHTLLTPQHRDYLAEFTDDENDAINALGREFDFNALVGDEPVTDAPADPQPSDPPPQEIPEEEPAPAPDVPHETPTEAPPVPQPRRRLEIGYMLGDYFGRFSGDEIAHVSNIQNCWLYYQDRERFLDAIARCARRRQPLHLWPHYQPGTDSLTELTRESLMAAVGLEVERYGLDEVSDDPIVVDRTCRDLRAMCRSVGLPDRPIDVNHTVAAGLKGDVYRAGEVARHGVEVYTRKDLAEWALPTDQIVSRVRDRSRRQLDQIAGMPAFLIAQSYYPKIGETKLGPDRIDLVLALNQLAIDLSREYPNVEQILWYAYDYDGRGSKDIGGPLLALQRQAFVELGQ